jgi:predicted DsbA family dithiol-disulfide isomerase
MSWIRGVVMATVLPLASNVTHMVACIEVFADVTCPFTHVGLKQVVRHVAEMREPVDVVVRAWPLEWVNGAPLAVDPVIVKAQALSEQLGVDDFSGLRADRWPDTTLPALELAAAAYARDAATGLAVSMELRSALFEHGIDVADPDALAMIAAAHHLDVAEANREALQDAVHRDYEDGQRRGVRGSPHFFVGDDSFFCPALDLGHDADGHLTARFDSAMLADFFARVDG